MLKEPRAFLMMIFGFVTEPEMDVALVQGDPSHFGHRLQFHLSHHHPDLLQRGAAGIESYSGLSTLLLLHPGLRVRGVVQGHRGLHRLHLGAIRRHGDLHCNLCRHGNFVQGEISVYVPRN